MLGATKAMKRNNRDGVPRGLLALTAVSVRLASRWTLILRDAISFSRV